MSEAEGLDASVSLESIGCILSLREVYDKVLDAADSNLDAEFPQ
ncbi:MAG: hypothetical protein PHE96_00945 [Methylococcales bacterium]|nr:hypothetical protein [Methylococcales bacterium]